jgi:flagellar biosynthesis/type III secretory pathway chaperone
MIDLIETLVAALREELKQYGEMLALLDHQQAYALQRQTDDLLRTVADINAQGGAIQTARRAREQYQRNLARQLDCAEDATFAALIPRLPANYQPLVQALVEENNELLERIQRRARQNHLLLSRAVDLMQRFLSSFFPAAGTPTYGDNGQLVEPALSRPAVFEFVG